MRKPRAPSGHQIQRSRQFQLPDADFGQQLSFHFPLNAHSRHDGHAHSHLHEALDAFNGRHFDVAAQLDAVFLEELDDARAVGRFDVVRDEGFVAEFLDVHRAAAGQLVFRRDHERQLVAKDFHDRKFLVLRDVGNGAQIQTVI